jgi:hypothetical protein
MAEETPRRLEPQHQRSRSCGPYSSAVGRALGEKFLSELQCIAFRPISRLEQPTAKAGLYDMHDVACGGDPRLRQENLVVLNRHHADCVAIGGSLPELNCGNLANRHWKLH